MLNHTLINDNPGYRLITGVINFWFSIFFCEDRVICVLQHIDFDLGCINDRIQKVFCQFHLLESQKWIKQGSSILKIYASVQ